MPRGRSSWRGGAAASFAFHALLLILIIAPFAALKELTLIEQGAGGQGPAGGGGGGTRGTGGVRHESLRYVTVAPAPTPAPTPVPVIPPPQPPKLELPKPELPKDEPPAVTPLTPTVGVGGGTGTDGTAGTGTGTGGGIGTGVGTGTGSGTGPGTGGGTQALFPPSPIQMIMPPLPTPKSVKGSVVVVQFDVDETGRVRGLEFTPTSDRGYNRRLREALEAYRFKPGHRPDGTPVRMKYQMELDLP